MASKTPTKKSTAKKSTNKSGSKTVDKSTKKTAKKSSVKKTSSKKTKSAKSTSKTKSRIVEVEVAGIKKKITLNYIEEKIPFGTYRLLDATHVKEVPKIEFLRLAEELNEAINTIYGKIFPPGKTARDMINQQKK